MQHGLRKFVFFPRKEKDPEGKKKAQLDDQCCEFSHRCQPDKSPPLSLLLLFPKWSPSMATTLMIDDGNQVSRWKSKKNPPSSPVQNKSQTPYSTSIPFSFQSRRGRPAGHRKKHHQRLSKLISLLLSRVSFVIFLFSYYCNSQSFISLFFYGISLRRRRQRRKLSAFSLLPLRALCRFLDGKLVGSSTFTLMVSF